MHLTSINNSIQGSAINMTGLRSKKEAPKQEQGQEQASMPSRNIPSSVFKAAYLAAALTMASLTSCESTEPDIPFFNYCPKVETVLQKTETTPGKMEHIFKSLKVMPQNMSFDDVHNFKVTDKKNNTYIYEKDDEKSTDKTLCFHLTKNKDGEITEKDIRFTSYYKSFQMDGDGSSQTYVEAPYEDNCFYKNRGYVTSTDDSQFEYKIKAGKTPGQVDFLYENGDSKTYFIDINQ